MTEALLLEENTHLKSLILAGNNRLQELEEENKKLREKLAREAENQIDVVMPDKFNGAYDKTRGFINQLLMAFSLKSFAYANDRVKIMTLGTLVTGNALTWFNPYVEKPQEHQATLSSWTTFLEAFEKRFTDTDRQKKSNIKLEQIKQGKMSVTDYANAFSSLAAETDYNESALKSKFELGLSFQIRTLLIGHPTPTTLSELISLASLCDNALLTLRGEQGSAIFTPQTSTPTPSPSAMDIDAIHRSPGPLSAEERTHRMNKGLCLVCGEKGHLKPACPKSFFNKQDFGHGQ